MPDRLCCPVDAYMLVARGGKLLMLRRAADAAYAVAGLTGVRAGSTGVRAGSLEATCLERVRASLPGRALPEQVRTAITGRIADIVAALDAGSKKPGLTGSRPGGRAGALV